jgi:hypothetical protein
MVDKAGRPKCPRCRDGIIQLVTDGFIGETYHPGYHVAGRPLPTRWRAAPFGACNACEFCIEIKKEARVNGR